MPLEMLANRALVFRQAEEVVLLFDPLRVGCRMERTAAVDEILLLLEALAADAVPTFVSALVDVASLIDALDEFRHAGVVTRLRGADEIVERQVERPPGVAKHQ